jgi:hypothetical protein
MDDYFAILAARLTGAADAVRPLLPSRYEPASKLLVAEDTGSDIVDSSQELTVPRAARPTDAPQSAVHRPEAPSSPKLVNKNHTLDHSPEMSRPAQPIVAARIQPSAEGAPEPRRQPAHASKPKPLPANETMEAEDGPGIPRRLIQKEPRAATDTLSTPLRVRETLPKPREAPLHAAMNKRSKFPDGMGPRSRESGRIGIRLTPQTAVVAGTGDAGKKGPDVHISIGRIEVHAVHPPAAAPARNRTTPSTVSLEDYLARRNATAP